VAGLIALAVTAWLVLRARTWQPEVTALVPQWSAGPSAEPTPLITAEPEPWLVHVLGAVSAPGLVSLSPGARVADAIAAAGGLLAEANSAELNLAAELADGAQVIIGTAAEPRGEVRTGTGGGAAGGGSGTSGNTVDPVIDLNSATQAELETLPNVGPATASAILAWRSSHGRFTTVAELQEVDGIGPKTYAQLAPRVRV
jgi:competence protein ComEA